MSMTPRSPRAIGVIGNTLEAEVFGVYKEVGEVSEVRKREDKGSGQRSLSTYKTYNCSGLQ